MPDQYANHFWVCNFGGANGNLEAFTVEPEGAGFTIGKTYPEPFMVGMGNTDVEFGPDGKMYLACFNNSGWVKQDVGNVYTLFNEEKARSEKLKLTGELICGDYSKFMIPDWQKQGKLYSNLWMMNHLK